MNDKTLNLVEKISTDRNTEFLPSIERDIEGLKDGTVISMSVYTKYADGTTRISRSYSNNPQEDAGELLAMACERLGFER